MQEVFEKIRNRIESLKTNLGFGGTIQQMYADGMLDRAIEIVNQVAEECKNLNIDQDLTIVESLPSLYPLQPFEVEAIHRVVWRAKYNNGWIPCSKELPSDGEIHECTALFNTGMRYIEYAYYDMAREEWWTHDDTGLVNVIAWKSSPEPYRGE